MLRLQNLSVQMGDAVLLRGISCALSRGEMLCIIGESGSGKTTLLRALQGLMPAHCDRFCFCPPGQPPVDLSGALPRGRGLRGTSWVMQDPLAALNPRRRIGASIAEGLYRDRLPPDRLKAAVTAALAEVELDAEFHDRYPAQISLGQAQRACLARALIARPALIFFDEPLSALDAMVQKQIAHRMDVLRRDRGLSYVVVTHDLGFAAAYADRILVLHKGRVAAFQDKQAFFAAPASAYARSLIGAAQALGSLTPVGAAA
ncbi:ABC transporter ATP-binding protein [Actibacterium ureilyticum]|uniref:ABC transporter ATP-binding protein n=1 Tax=Actibacterium ureilyticum TaxID=1590614 RepID=UPI001FECE16F|nr:dipeptide/oligopeptide/nickel ABC transporter ATP-binding protein [Actibacterium ureilyticum]